MIDGAQTTGIGCKECNYPLVALDDKVFCGNSKCKKYNIALKMY